MFTARDCFVAFLFGLFVTPEEILSQFEDVRCRCICPEAGKLGIKLKNDEDRRTTESEKLLRGSCGQEFN